MSEYLPFLIIGIVTGSVYGLSAMGLVLTYKTSGIFNFGQGGVTAVAAYLFYDLRERGVPSIVAVLLVLIGFGMLAGLLLERIGRLLVQVPTANRVVGTIGLLLLCQAGVVAVYGGAALPFPAFLPQGNVKVVDTLVRYDQIVTVVAAGLAAIGMYIFFRVTRMGTEMRAVVDDSELLDMTGTDPVRVRRTAWVIGSVFAAGSGLLIAPTTNLDSVLLTLLVVQAFGAAAVGRFTSLPLAYAGGLVVGLLSSFAPKFTSDIPSLSGLPLSVPFFVLIVMLVGSRAGTLKEVGRAVLPSAPSAPIGTPTQRRALGSMVIVLALLVPSLSGSKLTIWSSALTYVLLFLSLNLLVRLSGQVSLCHIAFQAVGAAVFTHLTGLPWLAAVLLAGVAAVPLGLLAAIPAMRLPSLYLATTTLGLGILMQYLGYGNSLLFGTNAGREAPRPGILGLDTDRGYYYLLLVFVLVTIALVVTVERSRLGRLLRGLSDSPIALTTLGAGVNGLRVLVFCLSAFLAGVSGALVGPLLGIVDETRFNFLNSLIVLSVLIIAGRRSVMSPLLAALFIQVLPGYLENGTLVEYLPVLFGLGALLRSLAPAIALSGTAAATPADRRLRRPPGSAHRALSARTDTQRLTALLETT